MITPEIEREAQELDIPAEMLAEAALGLPPLADEEAHYLIRRLARIDSERAALKANYEALDRDLESRRERILALHGERLRVWTAAQLYGRKRSVRTLFGVAGFRTQPARVTVVDEDAALKWATDECPAAVRLNLDVRALPKPGAWYRVNPDTGEQIPTPPPGLEIVPERETFYVKAGARESEAADA